MMSDEIVVRFPGTDDFVRLARLTAADAGSRAQLDVDEIDDLRMAVSELCAIVGGGQASVTTLEFTISPKRVQVAGAGGAVALGERAEFAEALIAAVADEYEISRDGGTARFRIVKGAAPPPATDSPS